MDGGSSVPDGASPTRGEQAGPGRAEFRRGASAVRSRVEMRTDPTYRRMAEGFSLPDGSRRVYCHHVRKTAGTSLFLSFMALGGEDPMAVWRTDHRLAPATDDQCRLRLRLQQPAVLAEGAYFFGRSHRPAARPAPPVCGPSR